MDIFCLDFSKYERYFDKERKQRKLNAQIYRIMSLTDSKERENSQQHSGAMKSKLLSKSMPGSMTTPGI